MNTRQLNSSPRRGISLMEVLISMFVLAVGLLGVAALIPAGRHEIVEATKLETAAMVGRNAFRDIQTRGYLNPNRWWRSPLSGSGNGVYAPADLNQEFTVHKVGGGNKPSNQVAYAFDPLGRTVTSPNYGFDFPVVRSVDPPQNPPRLMRIVPFQTGTTVQSSARGVYDNIFRSSVDLTTELNATNKDLPPTQRFFENGTTKLRRMSDGNYSWLATVVSDPSRSALGGEVNVAVAVFYKRVLARTPPNPPTLPDGEPIGEYVAKVGQFPLDPVADPTVRMVRMPGGGEAVLNELPNHPVTGKPVTVKPGQWIMLAGYRMEGARPLNYYRWYRVLSAANPITSGGVTSQRATLAGQDWNIVASQTQVYIFDNIVNVYEKSLPLEL